MISAYAPSYTYFNFGGFSHSIFGHQELVYDWLGIGHNFDAEYINTSEFSLAFKNAFYWYITEYLTWIRHTYKLQFDLCWFERTKRPDLRLDTCVVSFYSAARIQLEKLVTAQFPDALVQSLKAALINRSGFEEVEVNYYGMMTNDIDRYTEVLLNIFLEETKSGWFHHWHNDFVIADSVFNRFWVEDFSCDTIAL